MKRISTLMFSLMALLMLPLSANGQVDVANIAAFNAVEDGTLVTPVPQPTTSRMLAEPLPSKASALLRVNCSMATLLEQRRQRMWIMSTRLLRVMNTH